MDIVKELEDAKKRREEIVNQINELAQQRQVLLQEALRLDGEVRAYERLSKDGNQSK